MSAGIGWIIIAAALLLSDVPAQAQAQASETQINLTAKQVEAFIAVQKAMAQVVEKMAGQAFSKREHAAYQAQLKARATRHGFKNLAEYQAVAEAISSIVAGIDPQTKLFTDPDLAIQEELERLIADRTTSESEKQKTREDLNVALRSAQSRQSSNNVELVQKYYDKFDVTNLATYEGSGRSISTVVRTISE
jgi:hypothetical protein